MTNLGPKSTWPNPQPPMLQGPHVVIKRLQPEEDVDDLYTLSHGDPAIEQVWRFMNYGPFPGRSAMLDWLFAVSQSRDPLYYSVFNSVIGKKVGMIAVMNVSTLHGRAELGHVWYVPQAQKTVTNTEVVYLWLRHLFDDLKYRRVEWKCDDENAPSKYAALRLGFTYEGVFRNHMVVKGKNRDTAWYSMIDEEWPERRKNFERYFSDQRLSLSRINRGKVLNE